MPQFVYLGPARSGKTTELLNAYREALLGRQLGKGHPAIWLSPNARAASLIRGQLLDGQLKSCLRPGAMTFGDLSALVIADSGKRVRPLPALIERELVRRVVVEAAEKKELTFFADAAGRTGFTDLLVEHIHELKRSSISPDIYAKARPPRGSPEQHRELALLYRNYERQLTAHSLSDEDGAHWIARDLLAAGSPTRFQQLELVVADGFTDFTPTQHDILRLLAQRAKQLIVTLPYECLPLPLGEGRGEGKSSTANTPLTIPLPKGEGFEPADSTRTDLFAKTAATRDELRYFYPKREEREFPLRQLKWPALDHAVRHIFRNPAKVPLPSPEAIDSLDRLEIVAAAGARDEIVQIARRIKQRLASGTSAPDEIAVVFRSLNDAAPRVREVFTEFGIPHYLETDLPAAAAPIVRTLLALLKLAEENWPFRRVVGAITNNTLTAFDAAARQAADWLVRDLQIADGGAALLTRVKHLAEVDTPIEDLGDHLRRRVETARKALPVLQLLSTALGELPREATSIEWRDALAKVGTQLGLFPPLPPGEGRGEGALSARTTPSPFPLPEGEGLDIAAWQLIATHLAALERLDAWLGQPPRKLTRHDIISTLAEIAAHSRLPRRHDDVGRVRVLGAQSARTLPVKHLFLAGMSEQAFPSPERAGRLGTDADYRFFARVKDQKRRGLAHFAESSEQSVPVPLFPTRAQDEMLLFYELLSRAEESLTISYPALDDKAQDLPPSPYVIELQRVFGEANQDKLRPTPPQLSPIPCSRISPKRGISSVGDTRLHEYTAYSLSDWRIQAVARALDKESDPRPLAAIFATPVAAPVAQSIDAGLRIIHARARAETHGPAEGLITSPAVEARLARRFGPDHLWSPSQWESYAACPYRFFLESVLHLEPLGDLTLEVDHRRRGSLAHDMLAMFHRKLRDAPPTEWAGLFADEKAFAAELQNTLQEVMSSGSMPHEGIEAALLELDKREIEKWIAHYRTHYAKYDSSWKDFDQPMTPAHFELRFGRAHRGEASPEDAGSVDNAFPLDIGDEEVLVTGRIDRIDIGQVGGKTVFNVIDYKSGQRPTHTRDKVLTGERLQPALYVMAAQALLFGDDKATPLWAGYWSMKNGVTTSDKFSLRCSVEGGEPTESWSELQPAVIERIRNFVRDIRAGQFPVYNRDPDCTSRCEFNTVCRVTQIRSLGKQWPQIVESRESSVESQNERGPKSPAPSP